MKRISQNNILKDEMMMRQFFISFLKKLSFFFFDFRPSLIFFKFNFTIELATTKNWHLSELFNNTSTKKIKIKKKIKEGRKSKKKPTVFLGS